MPRLHPMAPGLHRRRTGAVVLAPSLGLRTDHRRLAPSARRLQCLAVLSLGALTLVVLVLVLLVLVWLTLILLTLLILVLLILTLLILVLLILVLLILVLPLTQRHLEIPLCVVETRLGPQSALVGLDSLLDLSGL